MKITSRSALSFPASAIGISVIASSPGPPASQTIGSLLPFGDAARRIATDRLIVRVLPPRRLSGTKSRPQRACLSSAIGCGGLGQGPGTNDGDAALTFNVEKANPAAHNTASAAMTVANQIARFI